MRNASETSFGWLAINRVARRYRQVDKRGREASNEVSALEELL